jgi:hypothetical protein
MKAITGNRLGDGRVVYLGAHGVLVETLERACVFDDETEAAAALEAVAARVRELAGAYLIDVDAARPAGRERLRESIRQAGPTFLRSSAGAAA